MFGNDFKKFAALLRNDADLQKALAECATPEAATALALALGEKHGLQIREEDVARALHQERATELSDDDLRSVAGGLVAAGHCCGWKKRTYLTRK